MNNILQKMCTILGLLKDLLLIERLSDSCILQLVKTSFTTFLVDNIQLLQLKAIGLICGVQILFLTCVLAYLYIHTCVCFTAIQYEIPGDFIWCYRYSTLTHSTGVM